LGYIHRIKQVEYKQDHPTSKRASSSQQQQEERETSPPDSGKQRLIFQVDEVDRSNQTAIEYRTNLILKTPNKSSWDVNSLSKYPSPFSTAVRNATISLNL
jgi:hypothetical protein